MQKVKLHKILCKLFYFLTCFFSNSRLGFRKKMWSLCWLNSSFFWNWCNVNPKKIAKSDQLWLRGFVSIILNPFLRVFAISAFLKVIHAPKTPKRGYPENNLPTYIFFISLQSEFPMDLINTPMSRVTCPNVENPENQADQFWAFLPKMLIYYTIYYY